MGAQTFALLIGLAFAGAGILGFIPGLVHHPPVGAPGLTVDSGYGYLLGLFPINVLHNLVHLVIGALGLAAYRNMRSAQRFSQGLAIFYGLLAVMGLFPVLGTTFGLIPIFGNDVWLHGLTAAAAAYFGWVAEPRTGDVRAPRAGVV
jgi:hypothetical protein